MGVNTIDLPTLSNIQGCMSDAHDHDVPFLQERIIRAKLAMQILKRLEYRFAGRLSPEADSAVKAELNAVASLVMTAEVGGAVLTVLKNADGPLVHRVCGFPLAQVVGKVGRVICPACEIDVAPADRRHG